MQNLKKILVTILLKLSKTFLRKDEIIVEKDGYKSHITNIGIRKGE
jgi:hypothetical protein